MLLGMLSAPPSELYDRTLMKTNIRIFELVLHPVGPAPPKIWMTFSHLLTLCVLDIVPPQRSANDDTHLHDCQLLADARTWPFGERMV
jgi:hypothetical protein